MKRILLVFIIISITTTIRSQVTVGSITPPVEGALLDLKMNGNTSTKGLGLPRVILKSIKGDLGKTLGADTDGTLNHKEHIGLLIYNIDKNEVDGDTRFCPGLHVWNGEVWQPLTRYPNPKTIKWELISLKRSFEYLNPTISTNWPADRENDRASGKYNLGRSVNTDSTSPNGTQDLVDKRNTETNSYYTSRFYVGFKIIDRTYSTKTSYSCSTSEPDWNSIATDATNVTEREKIFDDGVWMTENLRTLYLPNGNSIRTQTSQPSASIPEYLVTNQSGNTNEIDRRRGVLYNWPAAIAVNTATGPTSIPTTKVGGDGNADVTYQGICPEGWYLPSDQEWTDLANGIVNANSSLLFNDQLGGSVSLVDYNYLSETEGYTGQGGYLGQAMKSKTKVQNVTQVQDPNGRSKTAQAGGFDAVLAGSGANGTKYSYGSNAYFWTSSSSGVGRTNDPITFYRFLLSDQTFLPRGFHYLDNAFSVRCKKVSK